MVEHYGFFNGEQQYGQEELARYYENLFESGVSLDDNSNMTLGVESTTGGARVSPGFCIIRGFYLYNDSLKTINITASPNYDRIDRIVVRLNISLSKVSIERKEGIASSKPIAPDLQRDNFIYELSLAQVYVSKNGTTRITDERFRKKLCGTIRPKGATEYEDMIKSFTEQFDRWFNSQQSKGWRNIFIQPNQPQESVAGSIWIKTLQ